MLEKLLKVRFVVVIIVICSFINALVLLGLAVKRSIEAYVLILKPQEGDKPAIHILESMDVFLVALVFLIFSLGLTKLFLGKLDDTNEKELPSWLRIKSFMELKLLLWQTILVSLVVLFVDYLYQSGDEASWSMLIIPISILILSISMYLIKKSETESN